MLKDYFYHFSNPKFRVFRMRIRNRSHKSLMNSLVIFQLWTRFSLIEQNITFISTSANQRSNDLAFPVEMSHPFGIILFPNFDLNKIYNFCSRCNRSPLALLIFYLSWLIFSFFTIPDTADRSFQIGYFNLHQWDVNRKFFVKMHMILQVR